MSNYINSYFLNVFVSFGLIETVKEFTKVELINNIVDLFLMLVMVLISRFVTSYIERKYKRFLVLIKKKFK